MSSYLKNCVVHYHDASHNACINKCNGAARKSVTKKLGPKDAIQGLSFCSASESVSEWVSEGVSFNIAPSKDIPFRHRSNSY